MAQTTKLMAVCDGRIRLWDGSSVSTPSFTAPITDPVMNLTGAVRSVFAFGKIYLVDNNNAVVVDPSASSVTWWPDLVTAGTFPIAPSGTLGTPVDIDAVSTGSNTFEVSENLTALVDGDFIQVTGSTGNDGIWTVASASGSPTVITVDESVTDATADGTLRRARFGECPRLIGLYRGRIVLSGFSQEPHTFWMSRNGDPLDWNTAPTTGHATSPIKGTLAEFGGPPDAITALIPLNDDVMLFGGQHSIYRQTGDPAAGGERDLLSDRTGVVWGDAWTKSPEGLVYFFGTNGVYELQPGSGSIRSLTQNKIAANMRAIDHSAYETRLEWDNWYEGLHVFITRVASGTSTHYFWDRAADGWWIDQYPDLHGPMATLGLDGDTAATRGILMGSRDGYVRRIDPLAFSDDGTAISSYTLIGPIRPASGALESQVIRIAPTFGENTSNVIMEVFVGSSPYEAIMNTAVFKRTYTTGGRKEEVLPRARGNSIYVKLSNTTADKMWSLEDLVVYVDTKSIVKART